MEQVVFLLWWVSEVLMDQEEECSEDLEAASSGEAKLEGVSFVAGGLNTCSTVHYSTVQYSIVQCSTIQYSTVQCGLSTCGAMPMSVMCGLGVAGGSGGLIIT